MINHQLSRRTFLRGVGVSMALPWLESTHVWGDVAPKRIIKGPKTNLANPTGVWVDLKNNELWAANFMNHSATVYPLSASGDVAPLRMIRSGPLKEPSLGIGNPHPVAYDSKREQILVPN